MQMDANDFMGQAELVLKPEGEGDDELRIPAQTLALEDGGKKTEVPVQGTITLRLDDPTQDVVREVVVVSASGLKKADLLGGSDPYAVVLWDGQRVGQTHHVPNTQSPQWNVGIPVSIPPCGGTARVEIYDHDDSPGDADDFLGQIEVELGGRGPTGVKHADTLKQKPHMLKPGPGGGKMKGKCTILVEDPSKQPPPVKRQIVIESAEYLASTDLLGKSDPYAKVFLNGEELGQTAVVEDSLDPVWPASENSFEVVVAGGRGAALLIEVYDKDVGPDADDLLGTVEIRLGGKDGLGGTDVLANEKAVEFELCTKKGKPAMGPRGRSKVFVRVEHPCVRRRLVIERATGLPEMDGSKACDPYARVFWQGGLLGRTQVIKRTIEPVWDKEFALGVPERGGKLRIVILDRDLTSKDDVVGEMEMDIGGGAVSAGGAGVLLRSADYLLGPPGKPKAAAASEGLYGRLRFRIEEPGVKRLLTVSRASALANADRGGTSDPFAVVTFNGETLGKTGVVRDTTDPLWNQRWEVMVPPAGAELEIEIFDFDDNSSDDFLGRFKCDVGGDGAEVGGSAEALMAFEWHDLTTRKGKPAEGRVEFAFEAIAEKVKDVTEVPIVREELGPVEVATDILGPEWNCWKRYKRSYEDEMVDAGHKRPIVQLGLKVDGATWEVEVTLAVVVEAYHIEERSNETELECRTLTEAAAPTLFEWKERRRQLNRAHGRLFALGRAEDALKARVLAVPRETLLTALFRSVDADGDGDLTRAELRHAPFGDTLTDHWVELDKDHDEGVQVDEWLRYFEELDVKIGWTAVNDLIVKLVWDAEVASTMRLRQGIATAEHKANVATAASKEDAKAAAKAYFASEDEKAARVAARGTEADGPENEAWMAAMTIRDETAAMAEEMKLVAENAAEEQAEAEAEVAAMQQVKAHLAPILSASLHGEEPAAEWAAEVRELLRQSEREAELCEEQLEALAPSMRLFNEAEATVLHIRGGLEALNTLSGGGGNPVRVKRQELKVDASLAMLGVHVGRGSRATTSAYRNRLAVVDKARHLLGRLFRVDRLYFVDDMAARMKAAVEEEVRAAAAVEDLAVALDYRREAKREAQRAVGAAAWTADVDNRFFAEESVKVKAAEVAKVEAQKYNDARKWSIGSRDAKKRAAAAREQLRVLERFEVEQPDVDAAMAMLAELATDARRWERDIALTKDLGEEFDYWHKRLNACEGTLMVLSKAFMEKAEAEMQLRAAAERRLREEAEALAREGGAAREERLKEEKILKDAEEALHRLASEKHAQPRRRLEVGCECVLRLGARETGCLKQHQLGLVEIYEASSNRAKVRNEDTKKLSWYSCDNEVVFCGPRPEEDLVELRAEMERKLATLKAEAAVRAEHAAFARKQAEKLRAYDAEMEAGARLQAEAEARAKARREVTARVRTQLGSELSACGERIVAFEPSTERRAGILRQLAVLDGALSGVKKVRTLWGRARFNIDASDQPRSMTFFAAEVLRVQEEAEGKAEQIGRMGGGGIDQCEGYCREGYDGRDQCAGALQFLDDSGFAGGTTERYFIEQQGEVVGESHEQREAYLRRRGAEMEMLWQNGQATVVRRLRALLGLGLGHPPLVKVTAADGTEQMIPRRPPDDLGGMLGLERRPVTPPTPPLFTPRMAHSNRPGPRPVTPLDLPSDEEDQPERPEQSKTKQLEQSNSKQWID